MTTRIPNPLKSEEPIPARRHCGKGRSTMSERISWISRDASLRSDRFPLLVRRVVHSAATGPIAHDVTKVMLVSSGTTTLTHETGDLILKEGQVVVLPSGQWYAGEPTDVVTTTTAYIDTAFLRLQARWTSANDVSDLLTPADNSAPIPVNFQTSARRQLHMAFERLLDSQDRVDPTFHRLTHVTRFLAVLAHNNMAGTVEHDVVRRATALLSEHLDAPWTTTTLAQAVAISRSQLTRLFQQHLRTSPAEFLRTERARRMAELLTSGNDTVEIIAREVGWSDPSHASRSFRQAYGMSPLQYRQH